MPEAATLSIIKPGMMTTVQDLGRPGHARFGVAPGGALDRGALILGNRLLGNDPGAAGLEITLLGPEIEFSAPSAIAVTGADLGVRLNGDRMPCWQPVLVRTGDRLAFDPGAAGPGARAYLCVTGGLALESVLGSLSTELIGAFGGWHGRALRAGDTLPLGEPELDLEVIARRRLAASPPECSLEFTARVVLGPQDDRFTVDGLATFRNAEFTTSAKSNRQGIRLAGPPIEHSRGADLVSEGIAHGAVQVPGDGQPIVLLAGRQTVGGYVKIASVIGADLDRFAQRRPGDPVRFEPVSVEEARSATLAYRATLGPGAVVETNAQFGGIDGIHLAARTLEREIEQLAGAWDPDGVVRVLDAIERTGVTSFSIESAAAGIKIAVRRGDAGRENATNAPATVSAGEESTETVVKAPVLGVFFRRGGPDLPPFVKEGDHVDAGQVICLIEVMKTYHEVAAPDSGILSGFLVDDGQFVEYGQEIARIVRSAPTDGK